MNSIITTHILPNMLVEVTTNHDQIIFTNFGDKKDQIFRIYPLHLQLSLIVVHVDKIVRIDLPISSFNIIKLSFTRFTSGLVSLLPRNQYPYITNTKVVSNPEHLVFTILSRCQPSWCTSPSYFLHTTYINLPSWSQQHSNFQICTSVLYLWFLIAD